MQPRIQLALDVTNLDASIAFYSSLFGVGPAKQRPGYANFEVPSPPLKLVLIEGAEGGRLNHLGVEVGSTEEVRSADARLRSSGLTACTQEATDCCYAVQDKVWVTDPDGAPWEWYTVLADSHTEEFEASEIPEASPACC